MQNENNIKPRAMTKSELATLYKISRRTLNKWIIKAGIILDCSSTNILTPAQVESIIQKIGEP